MTDTVRLDIAPDRVATIWFDMPGKSVNTLAPRVLSALDAVLDEVESAGPAGVVFTSAKPRSFLVGADLREMEAMDDAALDAYMAAGQRTVDRIAALPMPTVAAINGDALGGGFELALACQWRLAADEPQVRIGLPETTLGLVPTWGGASRLPQLVGLADALELLLSGRTLSPADAVASGLVDDAVPRGTLLETACNVASSQHPLRRSQAASAASRDSPAPILATARAVAANASAQMGPAPQLLVDIVESSLRDPPQAVAAAERRSLIDSWRSPVSARLRRDFFQRHRGKKQPGFNNSG